MCKFRYLLIYSFLYNYFYLSKQLINPDDWELARNYTKIPEFQKAVGQRNLKFPPLLPVKEGDIFDLGGVTLEVYHIPGHTPGGICLLERENRILFFK